MKWVTREVSAANFHSRYIPGSRACCATIRRSPFWFQFPLPLNSMR
jgi:hypothetical protein